VTRRSAREVDLVTAMFVTADSGADAHRAGHGSEAAASALMSGACVAPDPLNGLLAGLSA
jgi:hypothetical protein